MGLFDWFENKKAQFWRDETARTLFDADQRFSAEIKKKIANNVLSRILFFLKEINNLLPKEKNNLIYKRVDEIAKERRQNINEQQYNNPKWAEVAMTESYFNMYSGHFGKKLAKEAVMVIYWCRSQLTDKEINALVKKSGLSEDKIFGEL